MPEGFTEREWDRIEQFARTPRYARTPDILVPDEAAVSAEK